MQRLSAIALFSAFFFSVAAFSQTFQGALRGRVTDPSGSPTANVKVTLTEEATSATRATITNQQGEYVFTALTPGSYTVVAELNGFKLLAAAGEGAISAGQAAPHRGCSVAVRWRLGA